jgi:hypothetical protein
VAGVICPRIGSRSSGIVCKGAEESLSDKVGVPGGWGLAGWSFEKQGVGALRSDITQFLFRIFRFGTDCKPRKYVQLWCYMATLGLHDWI